MILISVVVSPSLLPRRMVHINWNNTLGCPYEWALIGTTVLSVLLHVNVSQEVEVLKVKASRVDKLQVELNSQRERLEEASRLQARLKVGGRQGGG